MYASPFINFWSILYSSPIEYPVTLEAYIDKYSSLVTYLADNATGTPASDPAPPEQTSYAISLQASFVYLLGINIMLIWICFVDACHVSSY
jgi:hypothetical protein